MAEEAQDNVDQTPADSTSDAGQAAADALADAQASVDQLRQDAAPESMPPESVLDAAAAALAAGGSGEPAAIPSVVELEGNFDGPLADLSGIDMLGDVDLHVTIELGRTQMLVEDVLKLSEGSVVELDKLAGDPVEVYVNGCLIARGEVLVLNDNFCIRISEIVGNLEEQAEEAARAQMQAL